MPAYLHHLETYEAPHVHRQEDLTERFAELFDDRRIQRLVARAGKMSGIETRRFILSELLGEEPYDQEGQASTAARNVVYGRESRRIALELAERILSQPGAPARSEITHVVFVTCTGFVNPGPDFYLVKDLGLPETTERYVVGFMGCYGAFPALRMAAQFCHSDPEANVLVVCLELCSLHMQLNGSPDSILGNTVFADGAAGGIVRGRRSEGPAYELGRFATATVPDGESAMAWSIGDSGFDLVLSGYVPKILSAEIGDVLTRTGFDGTSFDHLAVHPGGKAILDRVESALELDDGALVHSREVLRECGNMSSPTVLFVLRSILGAAGTGESVLAIAFGPGLTVETAAMSVV